MKAMFEAYAAQVLPRRFHLRPDSLVSLRCIGIGESAIQQKLQDYAPPVGVQLGFRATIDDVQIKLLFPAGYDRQDKERSVNRLAEIVGDDIYAIDGLDETLGDLPAIVAQLMQRQSRTLAIFETASQGMIAAKCLGQDWLAGAEVGLDMRQLLNRHQVADDNDLSRVAQELAAAWHAKHNADWVLVQCWQGGWSAYQDRNQVIEVCHCLHDGSKVMAERRHTLGGAMVNKQNQATLLALDLLRRHLKAFSNRQNADIIASPTEEP